MSAGMDDRTRRQLAAYRERKRRERWERRRQASEEAFERSQQRKDARIRRMRTAYFRAKEAGDPMPAGTVLEQIHRGGAITISAREGVAGGGSE